jgi:hypothetical protein
MEEVSTKVTLFLLKTYIYVHMSFAVMTHLAEGLCLNELFTMKIGKSFICLCTYVNANSVHDGMTICFVLGNNNNK